MPLKLLPSTVLWLLKQQLASGDASGIHFYRDAQQREADLLLDRHGPGSNHALVEIKSAATIPNDALSALSRLSAAVPNGDTFARYLIYGGTTHQPRSNTTIIPWRQIQSVRW